jgi:phosphatidylserine decarboxylase
MAYVLVGAIMVSSMETVFNGVVTPPYAKKPHEVERNDNINLAKGDELGRFNMGSTVILLFPPEKVKLATDLTENTVVKLGEKIATFLQ